MLPAPITQPMLQLKTHLSATIWFLSPCPSWAQLTPPSLRKAGICSCLKHTSANWLVPRRRERGKGSARLLWLLFCVGVCAWVWLDWICLLKEGSFLLPLSFCSCSAWKVLLQLTLVTGKRASSSQQNKGAASSLFSYSRRLRKAFLQGKAGASSLGKTPATTRARGITSTKRRWGFERLLLGLCGKEKSLGEGGQGCRGGEQHRTSAGAWGGIRDALSGRRLDQPLESSCGSPGVFACVG